MSSLYRTPARGVSTRSMTRRNENQQGKPLEVPDQQPQENSSQLKTENHRLETEMLLETKKNTLDQTMDLDAGRNLTAVPGPSKARAATVKSKSKSSASSKSAQRKKLELEAAEAKARIQMDLIERRLAADLADLEYSSQSEEEEDPSRVVVEKWLERSHQDLEASSTHPVLQPGNFKDETCAPPPPAHSAPPAAAGTDATVHMLACALKNLSTANTIGGTNSKMLSRLCTPRDLPSYPGDPMEWLSFKQAYYESTEVCNFSNKENLWRLRKCLHGPAKEAVSALLITATSPENVISALELQFGNSDLIISRILLDIKKLPTISHDYHKEIVKFSVKVQNYVAAVLALGQEEYLRGMNIVSLILSKMPTLLLSKWVDYSYPLLKDTSKLKLVVLSDFLSDEAVKVSQTAVNVVSLRNEVSLYKRKPFEDNRAQTVLAQSDQSDFSEKCRFCRDSVHSLPDCKRFKKSPSERSLAARKT